PGDAFTSTPGTSGATSMVPSIFDSAVGEGVLDGCFTTSAAADGAAFPEAADWGCDAAAAGAEALLDAGAAAAAADSPGFPLRSFRYFCTSASPFATSSGGRTTSGAGAA